MDPTDFFEIKSMVSLQNRIPEAIFWASPTLAAIMCAIHAARRAFRHPKPLQEEESERLGGKIGTINTSEAILVRYSIGQRLFHWTNAFLCLGLLVSGAGMYSPGLLPGIPTAVWFGWHRFFGVFLVIGIFYHIFGDVYLRNAGSFMVLDKAAVNDLKTIGMNFLGLQKSYPRHGRYNPLQILVHWIIALVILGLIMTGFVLWKPTRLVIPLNLFGFDMEFIFFCRLLHGLLSGVLLALIMGHFYFAVMIRKNWVISKAMLTGRIELSHYLVEHSVRGTLVSIKRAQGRNNPGC